MYLKVGILSSIGNGGGSISHTNFMALFTGIAVGTTAIAVLSAIRPIKRKSKAKIGIR